MQTRPAHVSEWRWRFSVKRLAGLADATRPGKRARFDAQAKRHILAALDEAPPKEFASWNGTLLARHLGVVMTDQVWRVS